MNVAHKEPDGTEVEVKTEHATVTHGKHGHHETVNVFLEPDDLVKAQVGGFVSFLREHAVVGVAIGFIIGLQAQTLVKQLVTSFITPLLTLIVGQKMQSRAFVIGEGPHQVSFPWGQFVYALADFLVVLLCIYVVVKLLKLDKFDKPQAVLGSKK